MAKTLLSRAADAIEPRLRLRTLDWSRKYAFTWEGKPFDHSGYPHIGAPGGPFDAADCPQFLSLWMQFGSRLGKTFAGQCITLKTADCNPCPMMLSSSDQKLAVEVTQRTQAMIDYCERLSHQKLTRQRQDLISLRDCRIFVAWARSVSTLADKAVRVGHANEIDKWEHLSTSKEADPLKLFSDRFKEFPSHKKIYESTPAMKHSSRIERGRLASFNATFCVPCPHCWRYQPLRMDLVQWDKNEAGKSDKDLARRTARYSCAHCKTEIRDEHRGPMMRGGVWVPEGCGCDDEKARRAAEEWRRDDCQAWQGWQVSPWVTGKPLRDGRDAGYQLSSLYALSLSWGDIAAEWVDSQRNPQNLRNFVNQWLAETWQVSKQDTTWEQLGKRLMRRKEARGTVPAGFTFLTAGVDKQENHYVFVITAWDYEFRSHVVDYGVCETEDELLAVLQRKYAIPGESPVPIQPVAVSLVLIDSGYRPKGIHELVKVCKSLGVKAMPCRGSSQALGSLYRKSLLGKDSASPGSILVYVDTITSQDWIERQLHRMEPTEPGGMTLFIDSLDAHQDFLSQLLNEAAVQSEDKNGHTREAWQVVDQSIPNDDRDCVRYAAVAAQMVGGKPPPKPKKTLAEMRKQAS